jgi:circadian clock protein KaiA
LTVPSYPVVRPQLFICIFVNSSTLARSLLPMFDDDRYAVVMLDSEDAFFELVEQEKQQLDCLILQDGQRLLPLINWLHAQATLLPIVIVEADPQEAGIENPTDTSQAELAFIYHTAEVWLPLDQVDHVKEHVDRAIADFLNLSPSCLLPNGTLQPDFTRDLSIQNFLMLQQRRLTDKLKERLGYLGVYYKRNPKNFLRHLPLEERRAFITDLKKDYREIVLTYFTDDLNLNQKIDNFVNIAFFADISVAQIVETHMELMDEFSKQLKLEGRSEEVLLDYRLTLIDTLAHLCEMYRRSIPRES